MSSIQFYIDVHAYTHTPQTHTHFTKLIISFPFTESETVTKWLALDDSIALEVGMHHTFHCQRPINYDLPSQVSVPPVEAVIPKQN